jgi:uncharacterized repeat protein (TIGR01451 family)
MLLSLLTSLFGVASVQAVPIDCSDPSLTTLDDLIVQSASGGCFSQDKLFTNFAYTGSDPTSLIAAQVIFQTGVNGQDIHGWTFAKLSGAWITGFTLSYTVSVFPPNPLVTIAASKDQIDTGLIPNGTSLTDTQSVGVLNLNGLSTANETGQMSYGGVASVTTTSVFTIPAGSLLVRYDQLFVENMADLSITKTNESATVPIGGVTVYQIVVTNNGPSDVTGAMVTDILPAAITSATWTCTASTGSSCTPAGSGSINDTINLLAGGTVTYSLFASISTSASGVLLNTANVTAPSIVSDPNANNNAAIDSDTLVAPIVAPTLSGSGLALVILALVALGAIRLRHQW